jgi:hypothetical protein
MAPKVLQQPKSWAVIQLVLSLAVMPLGAGLLFLFGAESIVAWVLFAAFGVLVAVSMARLTRPIWVALDGEGFKVGGGLTSKTWGRRWSEVERFYIEKSRYSQAVTFALARDAPRPGAVVDALVGHGVIPRMPGSMESLVQTLNEYRTQALAEAGRP